MVRSATIEIFARLQHKMEISQSVEVLLPSKFLLDYNLYEALTYDFIVLLPSKFLLDYNSYGIAVTVPEVLLPSKFLLDYNLALRQL